MNELLLSYDHLLIGASLLVAILFLAHLVRRRLEHRRAKHKLEEAVRLELNVPTSLHPVIDPDVCIGSGSCISACPEGKILGLVDGAARLLNASKCIGHGKCAVECPVGAIKLVFGTAERGVELPEVDEHFQTSRLGVHIVGELAGMGLIKNALVQGLQVAAHLGKTVDRKGESGGVDVAIVGAGPAGIATAVGCRAAGLSFALIEQDSLGGTVAHYPRHKLVMTTTVDLPYYGKFGQNMIHKEALVQSFQAVIAKAGIQVHEKTKVTGLDGQAGAFWVATDRGVLGAKRVVLAIGRRGTPRRMGVPGEELDKVAYRLVDPRQYGRRDVLVVGGGDSAIEAAIQLAEESDARVAISYRRPEFARCRPLNKQKIDRHIESGRVAAYMGSDVMSVEPQAVVLKNGVSTKVPNDFVIACLGGELPNDFLKSLGISLRKHFGDKAMANPTAGPAQASRRGARLATAAFYLLGTAIVVALAAVGYKYYLLPRPLRYKAPGHAFLKPSGLWGHGVGIVATLFMLLNFVYPIRKRVPWFKGKGSIAPWLRFHVFVGIMSPVIILFHTAFQWGNQLATTTYVSVLIVVATGLVGRYVYGWVRVNPDEARESKQLTEHLGKFAAGIPQERLLHAQATDPELTHVLSLIAGKVPPARSLPRLFFTFPRRALRLARGLRHARTLFLDSVAHHQFCAQVRTLVRLQTKLGLHRRFKRFMSAWRALHVVLALLLLLLIAGHVWVSLRVGFRWLWS